MTSDTIVTAVIIVALVACTPFVWLAYGVVKAMVKDRQK